jgi:uncharacterized sulfatase
MPRPNILVFFTDQQRWDTCGCYGQRLPLTPHLDRLAGEGVRFERAFTNQPVCGPARAILQTGRYATEVGCHVNHRMLPIEEPTVAKALGRAGYETAYIGKWHLSSFGPRGGPDDFRTRPVPPERRGGYADYWLASDTLEFTSHSYDGHMFDAAGQARHFPPGRFRADAQTDWVLEYLRNRTDQRPFFLFVSYIEPHHQNDHNHYEGPHGSKERFARFDVPGDLAGTGGDWAQEYPDYLGCIHALDQNLGRVMAELKRLGLADDTLVLFTSDHGSHFRTRNAEYKRSCHDGCIRIPFVARGPGFRGGRVADALVSLIDLPPTLLDAAGLPPLPTMPTMRGRSLRPLAEGPVADWPREVFLQISESQCGRAIRTDRWKYSVRAPDKDGQNPASDVYVEDFLYDLAADPHERTNRVSDPPLISVRTELRAALLRHMAAAGEPTPRILPATPIR